MSQAIAIPALYHWPPRPLAALRYLTVQLFWPWGLAYLGLAALVWSSMDLESMATLHPGWICRIWLRNAALLTLLAGGLYYLLYHRRIQGSAHKFDARWPVTSDRYLGHSQLLDNMCYSVLSGCTFWTLYESFTWWCYATGRVRMVNWTEAPVYLVGTIYLVFFWSTFHFYLVHRLIHVPAIYGTVHAVHHRNSNPIPWSGISMHPLEHALFFTVFLLWCVVPTHPVVVLLTGWFQALSPTVTHSGFRYLDLGFVKIPTGDLFHQLHHMHFEVNYGNLPTPLDKLAGTFHDGTAQAQEALKHRRYQRAGA